MSPSTSARGVKALAGDSSPEEGPGVVTGIFACVCTIRRFPPGAADVAALYGGISTPSPRTPSGMLFRRAPRPAGTVQVY